jgi:hypothetical protein
MTIIIQVGPYAGMTGTLLMTYYDYQHTGRSPDVLFVRLADGREVRVLSTEAAQEEAHA